MAVYTVRTRDVMVLGKGWFGQTMAYTYKLPKDVPATREGVQDWLDTHAGDFQSVADWAASIEEIEIPWETEEHEYEYMDIMYPEEEDES